jgi:hypothetical protein
VATKNEIVGQLFTSKEFNDCIVKMEPDHLRDDLKAEVALILLETPDEKIIALHERKELKFYAVRIILNLIQSPRSSFYKTYRQHVVELTDRFTSDDLDIEARESRERKEDSALKEIDNLYWYNQKLLHLYIEHGNYRAIEKETHIPYSSAYKTIQASLKIIKQKTLQ